jgi:hypothetical protein
MTAAHQPQRERSRRRRGDAEAEDEGGPNPDCDPSGIWCSDNDLATSDQPPRNMEEPWPADLIGVHERGDSDPQGANPRYASARAHPTIRQRALSMHAGLGGAQCLDAAIMRRHAAHGNIRPLSVHVTQQQQGPEGEGSWLF